MVPIYRIQTGAFSFKFNAQRLSRKLQKRGFENFIRKDGLWRCQVGAYSMKSNADHMAKRLKIQGFDTYILEDSPPEEKPSGLPKNTWWGVHNGENHNGYNILMYNGNYPFGCNGDSRHKGIDIRPKGSWVRGIGAVPSFTRNSIYAWGRCVVRINGYDAGGYYRYIQVYFPKVNMTLTLGHLKNGSTYPVGTWFNEGDHMGDIGTKRDGLGARHVHYRVSRGDWGEYTIPPCRDMNPFILWNALDLPT